MKKYIKQMKYIMKCGKDRENRTGIKTRSVFGMHERYDMSDGFPILTTKAIQFESIKAELLCFIHGFTNVEDFKRMGTNIWNNNSEAPYWKEKAKRHGDLGRIYGAQWRDYKSLNPNDGSEIVTDQLASVLHSIKTDPFSRRLIVSAWNPGELDFMCLPPCHVMFQFYVCENRLSLHMYQRSADWFLGVPFNIASYSMLLHLVAHECGLIPHEFVHSVGDAHIYHDHFDAAEKQMQRSPHPLPKIGINNKLKSIFDFKMHDIWLDGYIKWPAIKASMAI